jgi:hypothetical protein
VLRQKRPVRRDDNKSLAQILASFSNREANKFGTFLRVIYLLIKSDNILLSVSLRLSDTNKNYNFKSLITFSCIGLKILQKTLLLSTTSYEGLEEVIKVISKR